MLNRDAERLSILREQEASDDTGDGAPDPMLKTFGWSVSVSGTMRAYNEAEVRSAVSQSASVSDALGVKLDVATDELEVDER